MMSEQMSKGLKEVSRLYLDTNLFIYFLEESTLFADKVEKVFNICEKENISVFTSEITITECLIGAYKKENLLLIEKYKDFFQEVSEIINIIPISSEILWDIPKVKAQSFLKLIDRLHITTAISCVCDGFLTNDKKILVSDEMINVFVLSEMSL